MSTSWRPWPQPFRPPAPCHCEHITEQLDAIRRQLSKIEQQGVKTMAALDDLKAADQALQAEVATFLADIAAALSAEDPDIEQVVSDINAQVAALQGGDPATPPATP